MIQCLKLEDKPRFEWRGCLIDEARHFLGKDVIKRQIDLLSSYKLNRMHWHLTDDQGWRIEIKKYPQLTKVGAWRGTDRYGGFYTKRDIREIVKYAESRHVLIVPEIEMPGHALAALASYPNLGCRGQGYEVGTNWGIFNDVYCPGTDELYPFLENVLSEVMEMFPSQYIHIGGDEVPKERWQQCPKCQSRMKAEGLKDEHELQSYFIRHFDKFLQKHGRRMIGWDEILDDSLAKGTVVQAWRSTDEGIKAANQGHDVIMSPTSDCYFNYGYDAISPTKVFFFDPIPNEVKPESAHHVLGLEGNLWGEGIPNAERLDFQGFPRLCALAEVGWSPKEARDAVDFAKRLRINGERLDLLGVKYNHDATVTSWGRTIGQWEPTQITAEFATLEWDITKLTVKPGVYEATLKFKAGNHGVDIDWVALLEDGTEVSRDPHHGFSGYDKDNITYRLDLHAVKSGAKYLLRASVRGKGGTDSAGDVLMLVP
jgi:hexosaminidase